jgi:hypothetical protein
VHAASGAFVEVLGSFRMWRREVPGASTFILWGGTGELGARVVAQPGDSRLRSQQGSTLTNSREQDLDGDIRGATGLEVDESDSEYHDRAVEQRKGHAVG